MLDYRRALASDPDDPSSNLDNHLKQIKLFALDLTYVTLVWVLLFIGVSFSVAPIYLAPETDRPALIRGLQVNARFFIFAILIVVGGKLVQETILAFLIKNIPQSSQEFSEEEIMVLKQAANRQIERERKR